ncbi:MAG: diguanylate cyclase [Nitrospiraceae bacterium]
MKHFFALLLPGGLIVLAAVLALRPRTLPDSMVPFLRTLPYAIAVIGLFLGWFFNRSRIAFAILVLAIADRILLQFGAGKPAGGDVGRIVFHATALLLPLNLVACAMIKERGLLTSRGLVRVLPILVQALLIALLCRPDQRDLAVWLWHKFINTPWPAWTPLAQPALVAFGIAMALQAARFILYRNVLESGFLWALVAAFLALHGARAGWVATTFFGTAGLVLVVSLIQTSHRMAYHDELTGVPGRRAMNEALLKLGSRYAVAMVDVDHFKQFNDRYGHRVGDQMLRMVAAKLGEVSGGGEAFRYGGEEFSIIFPGKSVKEALPYLEILRKTVEASGFVLRGRDRPRKKPAKPRARSAPRNMVSVTVSIGVAERDGRNQSPDQVIKAADRALYRAKQDGRNQVRS